MFVGRKQELEKLNSLYESGEFEVAVIYGRRRVGKTALLREFIKDKKAVFLCASETGAGENLERMAAAIREGRPSDGPAPAAEKSPGSVLSELAEASRGRRCVMVIDDYQFLESGLKGFSALLEEHCGGLFRATRLMLILCVSTVFAREQVLTPGGALYGAAPEIICLEPFDFFEAKSFLKGFSAADAAAVYGVTGGVPLYLEKMDAALPLGENIRRNFLTPSSLIFGEAEIILRRDVRDLAFYNAILACVAQGLTKNSQIARKTGLQTSACAAYLNNLSDMGLVRRNTPVTRETSRKTAYTIGDGMLRFWYGIVQPLISEIGRGDTDLALERAMQALPLFLRQTFIDVCIQWLWRENCVGRLPSGFVSVAGRGGGKDSPQQKTTEIDALKQWLLRENAVKSLPLERKNIGSWWGGEEARGGGAGSIDIMAHADDGCAIFGMCEWDDGPSGTELLETLLDRIESFAYLNKYVFLFSKAGFSPACSELAARHGGINLVDFEQIWNSQYN